MQCPECSSILFEKATSCGCGWKAAPARRQEKVIDPNCPWNDYGRACGIRGSLSDGMNGGGPFYCPEHFARLKGWPAETKPRKTTAQLDAITLLEAKEFCEARGLDTHDKHLGFMYRPRAALVDLAAHEAAHPYRAQWYAVRGLPYAPALRGNVGKLVARQREPGDDDEEVAA